MENKVTVPQDELEYLIVLRHNVLTKETTIEGLGRNFIVELGMLEWAIVRLKRADAENQMAERLRNQPRILGTTGPFGKV